MSKPFDRVWDEGLIFKLKSVGVSNSLLRLIESLLSNRFQKVLLNDQTFEWSPVKAGVSQGSILGPLFSLFILMTYQTIYYQQQDSLQMTHHYFLL